MDRRSFLKLSGLVGATTLSLSCAKSENWKHLYARLIPDEAAPLGQDQWYATLCRECSAGCSVIVRVMEGRAKKIEGNPLSPVNRGKSCARGQVALQALYNPDRWQQPQIRRESGALRPATWDEALALLAKRLSELKADSPQRLLILTPPLRGHLHRLFDRFTKKFGPADWIRWEPFESTVLRHTMHQCVGLQRLPDYDIENADFILSFGADFLGTDLSPVHFAHQFGRFRQGDRYQEGEHRRGRFYQIEPRLSLTAANADRWIPIEPGKEGLVALALARLIVEQGGGKPTPSERARWQRVLSNVSLAEATQALEAERDILEKLAERLLNARRPLVLGGGTAAGVPNGSTNLRAIHALNYLLGNRALIPNPPSPLGALAPFRESGDGTEHHGKTDDFARLEQIGQHLLSGESPYGVVLIYGVNPAYALPGGSSFRQALGKIPFLVSTSPFPDETAEKAHLIVPTPTPLEEWGDGVPDPAPGLQTWALAQPVVAPLYETRSIADIVIATAKILGGATAEAMPWKDSREMLEQSLQQLYTKFAAPTGGLSFDEFWNLLLAQGGWYESPELGGSWPGRAAPEELPKGFPVESLRAEAAAFEGDASEFPFYLLPYPTMALGDGAVANRPWLQELGDPLTTVVWGSWAEVNPKTMAKFGLREGDEVRLETPVGAMEVPAYLYPGIRPDTVAVPAGGGHWAYGRFANGHGANVMDLLPARPESETGALAWISTRVRIRPTGRKGKLVKLEGTGRWLGEEAVSMVEKATRG